MESQKSVNRSDDIAFIKLVLEVERLTQEVNYLSHLLYMPNGNNAIVPRMIVIESQLSQLIHRQMWLGGIGAAILGGVAIQIIQFFMRK